MYGMNNKIRDVLFFIICISLIFNNIPKPIQMNFIGGPVGNKLVFYPLSLGIFYTIYCEWKYKNIMVNKQKLWRFIELYLCTSLISLLLGLYNYPYWDVTLAGPQNQIEKLPNVLEFLKYHEINIEPKFLMSVWICVRQIKGVFLETFWCFGVAYLVYCWYKDEWKRGLEIACKGAIASIYIFITYGIIDVMYLSGSEWAKNILVAFNPYIHPIMTNNGWWPPLLWKGQLRSVFSEPSHVGNYLGVVFPLLTYHYLKNKKSFMLIIFIMLSFLVILTKARTAYAMMLGLIAVLLMFIIFFAKEYCKQASCIVLSICIGFYGGFQLLQSANPRNSNNSHLTTQSLVEDNLGSLVSSNARSNGARYALIKTNIRIALQHPLFGVGKGMVTSYSIHNFTDAEKSNYEVNMWLTDIKKDGVLRHNLDAMNEYVSRLSQSGFIGLIVFFIPCIYAFKCLVKQIRLEKNNENKIGGICITLSIIGSLAAGMNGSLNLMFSIWPVLGLAYSMIYAICK